MTRSEPRRLFKHQLLLRPYHRHLKPLIRVLRRRVHLLLVLMA